jgi:hypothetical protein
MSIYRNLKPVFLSDVHAAPMKTDRVGSERTSDSGPQAQPSASGHADASALARRKPDQPRNVLLKFAVQWADSLPREVQPRALMREFPRIVNMVALLWTEPTRTALDAYMDSLLVDGRGDRQGFPPDVVTDLLTLRAAFDERYRRR